MTIDWTKIGRAIAVWRARELGYDERADRAALAELRRLAQGPLHEGLDLARALAVPQHAELRRDIAAELDKADNPWKGEKSRCRHDFDGWLACVSGVLALVRDDSRGRLGRALADRNAYPEQRFKRLVRLRRPEELLREGQRLVHMLERRVPVADLAKLLLFWDPLLWGHSQRRDLALDYYGGGHEILPRKDDEESPKEPAL
ncbi:MAG: type I-E CRISPR-associated protein Cse2/CasB [Rhodospirillales bacterium]|nr:type I-E CRISPR-associated protein Cse2/CasB [Rhodospirillales bacterium]